MFKHILIAIATCSAVVVNVNSFAAVTADEAAKLKTALTPFGAEKAGNKEGTIPEWNGGYTSKQAKYVSGPRPDPFPGEKPILSITAKNLDQYADKLSDGVKAMLKKYPSYRLDVYPSHRTSGAPQWVYDNTFKNATRAKTTHEGNSVEGAYGGIPFPIPKTGNEAMWNRLLYWHGESVFLPFRAYTVTADGKAVMASQVDEWHQQPYYFKDGSLENFNGDFWHVAQVATAPPFKAGEQILMRDPLDQMGKGRQAWQYLPGQRRVRKAPAISYDTPDFVVSGVGNFDEAFVFMGSLDRYEWKLLGKQEMYIPYNNNRFAAAKFADVLGPKHLNPDFVRWELHRVWIVEANVGQGKRHVVPKRRYYLDEDNWYPMLGDGWDAQGLLWKSYYALGLLVPELNSVVGTVMNGLYNIQTGVYMYNIGMNEMPVQYLPIENKPDSFFTPDGMAGRGVR